MSECSIASAFGTYREYARSDSLRDLIEGVVHGRAKLAGKQVYRIYSFIDVNKSVQLFYCEEPGDADQVLRSRHCRKTRVLWDSVTGARFRYPRYVRKKHEDWIASHRLESGKTVRDSACDADELLTLLHHPQDGVFRDVVDRIETLHDPRFVPALCEILQSDNKWRVQVVAYALRKIGDDRSVEPLIKALRESYDEKSSSSRYHQNYHQNAMADALAKRAAESGDVRAISPVVEALSRDIELSAEKLFQRFPDVALEELRRALTSPSRGKTWKIVQSLKYRLNWDPEPDDKDECYEFALYEGEFSPLWQESEYVKRLRDEMQAPQNIARKEYLERVWKKIEPI